LQTKAKAVKELEVPAIDWKYDFVKSIALDHNASFVEEVRWNLTLWIEQMVDQRRQSFSAFEDRFDRMDRHWDLRWFSLTREINFVRESIL
jgi:hypothetical protein